MVELITLKELVNRTYFFVRFGERQNLESLRDGHLYMHTTLWHNELEKKKGIKGQGDKNDGKFVLSNPRFQMFNCDTNQLIASGCAKQACLSFNKSPVFCLYEVRKENLTDNVVNEEVGNIKISYSFSDDLRVYVKKNYKTADSAMIISNPLVLIEQINKYANDHHIDMMHKRVRYSDFSINAIDRVHDYVQEPTNACFWKDDYFKLEQEYRIIFPSIEIDNHVTFDIGQIEDANIVDLDTFFEMRIDIVFDIGDSL